MDRKYNMVYMQQKPHVPQFGKWETDATLPYTKVFDNARKVRTGGRIINPNDPEENPEAFEVNTSPVEALPSKDELDSRASKPKDELSSEDARKLKESLLNIEYGAHKPNSESPQNKHRERRAHNNRVARTSGGSDNSIDHSPVHPHYQATDAGKFAASPMSKGSSDGSRTSGGTRKTGARGDDLMDKGSAVPKFGDWDESNPSSGDGYTNIFDKVREEKETGSKKSPMITDDSIYINSMNDSNEASGCSCFGWFGKK